MKSSQTDRCRRAQEFAETRLVEFFRKSSWAYSVFVATEFNISSPTHFQKISYKPEQRCREATLPRTPTDLQA